MLISDDLEELFLYLLPSLDSANHVSVRRRFVRWLFMLDRADRALEVNAALGEDLHVLLACITFVTSNLAAPNLLLLLLDGIGNG